MRSLGGMTTATDMLQKYLAAEAAVLEGKEARIGDRVFRSEDLVQIIAGRREWEAKVAAEKAQIAGVPSFGGLRVSVGRLR